MRNLLYLSQESRAAVTGGNAPHLQALSLMKSPIVPQSDEDIPPTSDNIPDTPILTPSDHSEYVTPPCEPQVELSHRSDDEPAQSVAEASNSVAPCNAPTASSGKDAAGATSSVLNASSICDWLDMEWSK